MSATAATERSVRLPLVVGVLAMATIAAAGLAVGSGVLRYLYAAAAVGFAAIWVDKNPRSYVAFLVFLFMFTPLARRLLDLNAGYASTSVAMLAPYVAVLLAAPYCFAHVLSGRRHSAAMAVMFAAIAFALGVGILHGKTGDAAFMCLKWAAPLFVLGYLLQRGDATLARRLVAPLCLFGLLAAAYGVAQFLFMPPWDAYWMEMSPINSIGQPLPLEVRVFGSMNAPGSLATALGFAALLCLASPRSLLALAAVGILICVPLTMQRAAVGGIVVGLVALAILAGPAVRTRIVTFGIVFALVAGFAVASLDTLGDRIASRFAVGGDLAEDGSLRERLGQYRNFPDWMAQDPEGRGFGWRAAFDLANAGGPRIVLDSGLLDTYLNLGVVGGTAYLVALAALVVAALGSGAVRGGAALGAACAALAILVQAPLGTNHVGEFGFFGFLGLGLALAPERQA